MPETAEIPKLKIAKVGPNRRRDKGGAVLLFGNALGSTVMSRPRTAASLPQGIRLGIAALIATVGLGAYSAGRSFRPKPPPAPAQRLSQDFAAAQAEKLKAEKALRDLSAPAEPSGDSVGMVAQPPGETPPEQAANAVPPAPPAAKPEPKITAAPPAQTEPPQAAPASSGGDPAETSASAVPTEAPPAPQAQSAAGGAASPGEEKGGTFSRWFHSLTSRLGGGRANLAGGKGLSGGIGRQFGMQKLQGAAGQLTAFQGPSPATLTPAKPVAAKLGSGQDALGQLLNASALSNAARAPAGGDDGEASAAAARKAFEGASHDASSLKGPGGGAGPKAIPTPGATPDPGPSNNDGGPTGGPAATATDNPPPPTPTGKNATPWQPLVDMAKKLLEAATLLMILAFTLATLAQLAFFAPIKAGLQIAAKVLAICAAILGATVAVLGMAVMGMGQTGQGLILTLAGGLTAYLAWQAAFAAGGVPSFGAMLGQLSAPIGTVASNLALPAASAGMNFAASKLKS